ncbi:DUF58 domain-containing protein [Vagococcus bubulae]|uniref:DUF58 domain-containing protein n=1 Tax=Vagococcus bubulae TaxID=1977868 RepID=A0A429ZEX3_9ENTE|nr:DUF58 domain-containing protein [Vagococcus bubulae]RST92205.1 hypothetical protein CBF36_08950 [Vagococcus bubulae]
MSDKVKNKLNLVKYILLFLMILLYTLIFLTTIGWILLSFMFVTFLCVLISLKLAKLSCLNISLETYLLANREDSVRTEMTIQNKTSGFVFFPVLKITIEDLELTTYLYGYTGQKKVITIDWQANKRGKYETLDVLVESSDFFYFFYQQQISKIAIDWTVLPKLLNTSSLLSLIEERQTETSIGEVSYDIKRYRPYTYGDSMKQVDWKLSTKHQEIMVKEFKQEEQEQPVFVFYPQQSFYFEKMLDVFFSLYKELENKPVSFYFANHDENSIEITDIMAFSEVKKQESTNLSSILIEDNQSVILFIPEMTNSIQKEVEAYIEQVDIQVITYEELKKSEVVE